MTISKIDTTCARLRDIGIFFIGISAIAMSAYFIYERTHSPQRMMERAMQQLFADGMENAGDDAMDYGSINSVEPTGTGASSPVTIAVPPPPPSSVPSPSPGGSL